jgi:recombination protein RecA
LPGKKPAARASSPVPVDGAKALSAAAAGIRAKYGEKRTREIREKIIVSTGSMYLDWGLRVGGLQNGRVYEFFGPPGAGKSTCAITCMTEHLKRFPGRGVAYIDMEDTFDEERATAMGLDCSVEAEDAGRWMHTYPEHSEHVSDMARDIIKTGAFSCVVVDSLGAMESDRTNQKKAEDAADAMGRNAKIITQMSKALATMARLTRCTVILVNQPRAPVGSQVPVDISSGPRFVQHTTTAKLQFQPLGGAEHIHALRLAGELDDLDVSIETRIRIPRLKNGLPGRVVSTFLNRVATPEFGPPGWDVPSEALDLGTRLKIIKLGGAWYTMPNEARLNGKAAALAYLRENPSVVAMIRDAILFEKPAELFDDEYENEAEGAEANAG